MTRTTFEYALHKFQRHPHMCCYVVQERKCVSASSACVVSASSACVVSASSACVVQHRIFCLTRVSCFLFQSAQRKVLDVINSVGMGETLLRLIERRQRSDIMLTYGGMVGGMITTLVLVCCGEQHIDQGLCDMSLPAKMDECFSEGHDIAQPLHSNTIKCAQHSAHDLLNVRCTCLSCCGAHCGFNLIGTSMHSCNYCCLCTSGL